MQAYFFIGKGGTGKTTVSSALAWQLAKAGYNTLLASLDPAHNLYDIFEIEEAGLKYQVNDLLEIQQSDFEKIKREYFKEKIQLLKEINSHLTSFNLENYLKTLEYAPGQEEYAIILFLKNLLKQEKDYQYLVFDTPPTGLLLKILSLPVLSLTWIEKLIDLRQKIVDRKEMIGNIKGEEEKPKYYSRDQVLTQLKQQKEDYKALSQFYRKCNFYIVMNPDLIVEKESKRLIDQLGKIGIKLEGIVNNKCDESYRFEHIEIENIKLLQIGRQAEPSSKYKLNVDLLKTIDVTPSD
ncbi:MAG: TRC40/GET3/ArsA family transport-energizing ATPase [Candidatus Marinimicrobia bacterium]|nr:TRC40/GET3/ArsA family transport-energizing ATPase [Candidatus Neomarinimicrobiota bacterium]